MTRNHTSHACGKTPISIGTSTMSSSAVVPISTPPSSPLPSNATMTTTAPLFKTKPMVLCQLVSPSYFRTGTLRNAVEAQEVPSSTLCDYILLDLPLAANGSFEFESYRFLTHARTRHRLLFHVDIDLNGVGGGLVLVSSSQFVDSVRNLQNSLSSSKLHGLGVLKGYPTLLSQLGRRSAIPYLGAIYEEFSKILRGTGVEQDKIKNFLAFNPGLITQYIYREQLQELNGITHLNFAIILTITNERVNEVYPSSAWDNRCLPQTNESTMVDVVSTITSIRRPMYEFALAFSLRLDHFAGVSLAKVQGDPLQKVPCRFHNATWFSDVCESQLFGRGPSGASIYYIGGSGCAFAEGNDTADTVVSFETPRTIRHKMVETYRKIGYDLTDQYVINWVVYNMTYGLAPDVCNGAHNRILEIRNVIDENK
ncbi:uncharacterized protein [Dermacentor albipictus]|uniref:uncharacterized protein isoform X2 n=1 Tax=Dermacentor albipictus TaxID=60249 RepID=UPI0031FC3400